VAGLVAAGPLASADSTAWRGPAGDGISPEKNWNPKAIAAPGAVAWKVNVGKGYSGVGVKGDRLYTLGNSDKEDVVVCLAVQDGKELWRHAYPCGPGSYPGPRATPILDGPAVFTLSREGDLFCLNAADGKVLWHRNLCKEFGAKEPGWGLAGTPRIEGDLLIVNAGLTGIALAKKTGEKVWAGEGGVGGYSAPVPCTLAGKPGLVMFGQKEVYAVQTADGRKLWAFPWETSYDVNAADPLVAGTHVFISSGYGKGCVMLDVATGTPREVWKHNKMCNHFSSCVLMDGHIYGIDGNAGGGNLRCLELKTGSETWGRNLGFGGLLAADGKLIVLNEHGKLFVVAAKPGAYEELAAGDTGLGKTCWTAPVLANGRIYCRNDRGDLVCLDVSK